jgi:hypothetical protein
MLLSDQFAFIIELDYTLAMKLDLVAAMVALAVASDYLFHYGASLRCAQLMFGVACLT